MIKELVNYIEANTSFVAGTTLFALSVDSDTRDECVVVAESSPGLADGILTDYRQVPLTVYVRSLVLMTARDNAYTVFNLLHGGHQLTLGPILTGSTYTVNVECRTPYYVGLDESGRRHMFSMPVDVTVTNMT